MGSSPFVASSTVKELDRLIDILGKEAIDMVTESPFCFGKEFGRWKKMSGLESRDLN